MFIETYHLKNEHFPCLYPKREQVLVVWCVTQLFIFSRNSKICVTPGWSSVLRQGTGQKEQVLALTDHVVHAWQHCLCCFCWKNPCLYKESITWFLKHETMEQELSYFPLHSCSAAQPIWCQDSPEISGSAPMSSPSVLSFGLGRSLRK